MTAGFYAMNPTSGTFVVDDTFKSLGMRQKNSVVLGADGRASITWNSPTSPMVAVACTSEVAVFGGTQITAGIVTWNLWGTPYTAVDYWIFDVPPASTSHAGLQIYNAAGELTFDSSLKYARYASYFTTNDVLMSPGSVTLTAGKKYAVVMLKSGWEFARDVKQEGPNSPEGNYYYREKFNHGGAAVNNNVVSFSWNDDSVYGDWSDHAYTAYAIAQLATYGHYAVQALILDVTGY